jgi:hypothetical protein
MLPACALIYSEDMRPRPNHVYVRHPVGTVWVTSTIFTFDLRKLDPDRIHADEDPFFDPRDSNRHAKA